MKRLFILLAAVLLAACATVNPRAQIDLAYSTVNSYVDATKVALARGRITPDQAVKAADNADLALKKLALAREVLSGCAAQPCADFTALMNGLQPNLLELERELRARESK